MGWQPTANEHWRPNGHCPTWTRSVSTKIEVIEAAYRLSGLAGIAYMRIDTGVWLPATFGTRVWT